MHSHSALPSLHRFAPNGKTVLPLLFILGIPGAIAHAQAGAPEPLAVPKLSPFAMSLGYSPWRNISFQTASEDAKRAPQLYIMYPRNNDAMSALDWFERYGLELGFYYSGTYSGPGPEQLRTVVADNLIKVLAMKNMPSFQWPPHLSNYQLPPDAYTGPLAKRRFTALIELLGPELAARGVTKAAAYSMFNQRTNSDALPKSHWASDAAQEMHWSGLLIGD